MATGIIAETDFLINPIKQCKIMEKILLKVNGVEKEYTLDEVQDIINGLEKKVEDHTRAENQWYENYCDVVSRKAALEKRVELATSLMIELTK